MPFATKNNYRKIFTVSLQNDVAQRRGNQYKYLQNMEITKQ